ncbi:uncharacterized protein JCM6883_000695 [Sporobolomyces salmoneus]|uniref:uncharacterized protein n=1 Tax=Sporobolomyces salmoneus TaxID=183962 RepID=UPI0031762195
MTKSQHNMDIAYTPPPGKSPPGYFLKSLNESWPPANIAPQMFHDDTCSLTKVEMEYIERTCQRLDTGASPELGIGIDWHSMDMLRYYKAYSFGELGETPHATMHQQTLFLAVLTPQGRFNAFHLQELHLFTSVMQEVKGWKQSDFLALARSWYPYSRYYSGIHGGALAGWSPAAPNIPSSSNNRCKVGESNVYSPRARQ